MREQCVPGPLLSFLGSGNEANLTRTHCPTDMVYHVVASLSGGSGESSSI